MSRFENNDEIIERGMFPARRVPVTQDELRAGGDDWKEDFRRRGHEHARRLAAWERHNRLIAEGREKIGQIDSNK